MCVPFFEETLKVIRCNDSSSTGDTDSGIVWVPLSENGITQLNVSTAHLPQ
jgi:hypothetical protein